MCVVTSCIFMSDAARQRDREDQETQSRTRSASGGQSTFRRCRAVGARLLHLPASGVPISRTSSATEGARPAWRSQTGVHSEAATQPDSASSSVRHNEGIVHQRGGQPSIARATAARARAWVSRKQNAHTPFGWSIDLIVCCRTNWLKSTSCWSRRSGDRSAASKGNFQIRQNPP